MAKFVTLIFFILSLIYIPLIVYYISLVQEGNRINQRVLAMNTKSELQPAQELIEKKESMLPQIVEQNFLNEEGEYSVVIKNLKTGEEYEYNENKKYNSASLYKLWVLAVVFQKIKDGVIKEDQVLSGKMEVLDSTLSTVSPTPVPDGYIQPEVSEEPKVISMTVQSALDKMIINSDNYAAILLAAKSGTLSITNFLKEYGLKDSNFKQPPKTTASDIALYFEKLYNGEIVDKENSSKMMEILKQQSINDRIPKYLPKDVDVAHKTGELYGAKHDGGIVFSDKGDYIIVVLSDTDDVKEAIEKTARFSEEIYNYFESI